MERLTILYKMDNGLMDIKLDYYIQHSTRNTRGHNRKFLQLRWKSKAYQKSFFPTAVVDWNSLPGDIVDGTNINYFKDNLKLYLKSTN